MSATAPPNALTLRETLSMMPAHERLALLGHAFDAELGAADPPMWMYVIQSGHHEGDLKIGISCDPQRRLRELQRSNPEPLRLLVQFRALRIEEQHLHEQYADLRIRGEWFRFQSDIVRHARNYAAARRHLG